jgi:hypothetical protein
MSFNRKALLAALGFVVALAPTTQAVPIFNADFEAFTVGSPPPTGALPDRPYSIDANLDVLVQNAGTVAGPTLTSGNFLHMGENPGEAPDLHFDVGTSFSNGIYTVSMDLLFENLDNYHVYFRNGMGSGLAPASQTIANIRFGQTGNVSLQSLGGTSSSTYAIGTAIHLETVFDLDADTWDAYLNGTQVVSNQGIMDGYLGMVAVGFDYTSSSPGPGFDGMMQLDNVKMEPIPEPATIALFTLGAMGLYGRARRRRK